ncbi:MAG: hypothetical protein U9N30_05005 [Campylobacterota bacterium]|nr:hypothetical protein [Campylobacterota bacterium]
MFLKQLFFVLILATALFSNQFKTSESSVFTDSLSQKKLPNTLPKNYASMEVENIIKTKNVHLQYTYYPKKAYDKQKFSVSLKAIISLANLSKIDTVFKKHFGVNILNPKSQWSSEEENIYTNTYEFVITDEKFQMPLIKMDLYAKGKYKESAKIPPKQIEFKKIVLAVKNFSNILADDLNIISQKTKQYDNKSLLTIMEIEASNSNLKEFHLSGYEKQGLESFSSTALKQKIFYYVITPIFAKNIQFNYYNTKLKKTILVKAVVLLKEDLVSTQTDLNPSNSGFLMVKKVILGVTVLLLLILLYFKRSILLLILILLLGFIFVKLMAPNKKMSITKNTYIYILPTKNSTVFHITDKSYTVEILKQKVGFSKILFGDQAIGWIKNENLHK